MVKAGKRDRICRGGQNKRREDELCVWHFVGPIQSWYMDVGTSPVTSVSPTLVIHLHASTPTHQVSRHGRHQMSVLGQ